MCMRVPGVPGKTFPCSIALVQVRYLQVMPFQLTDIFRTRRRAYSRSMPSAVRYSVIALSLIFFAVGIYHRILAAQSGERLDRTREGCPLSSDMRLAGLITFGSTAAWLWKPQWFAWAAYPVPDWVRWIGVAGFTLSITWLIWMFISLGRGYSPTR